MQLSYDKMLLCVRQPAKQLYCLSSPYTILQREDELGINEKKGSGILPQTKCTGLNQYGAGKSYSQSFTCWVSSVVFMLTLFVHFSQTVHVERI